MPSETPPKLPTKDPYRADAAKVYRYLVANPGVSVTEMASVLFPTPDEGPASTLAALRKRSVRRVLDSLVWMRHQGVRIWAQPEAFTLTTFSVLGADEEPPRVDPVALQRANPVVKGFVTDEVSQVAEQGEFSDAMGLYHPEREP